MADSKHASKAPARSALNDYEVQQLMQAFVCGKTAIREDDAITLLKWANSMRLGAVLVDMILAGEVQPVVEDGIVKVVMAPGSRN